MRIATLSNAAVIHTRRWVEHLRARGHEVRLWSLERGPETLGARPLPALPLPDFARYPAALGRLSRGLSEFRPDLVDAHYVPNYGLLGALALERPLSVAAWGSDLLQARGPLRRARVRWVLERAQAVIADSGNLAAAARSLGAAAGRVHEIPWGVDLDRFRAAGEREPGRILSTRMHEPVYDVASLIEGARPVLERNPGALLVVAGTGSRSDALAALAARILPPGRCRFVGLLASAELAGELARAEIYLSGSHSDSTSLSLLEAMAAGALPVVSDLEGNREWVDEGEGARLFTPGDAAGVTRALERALADPEWAAAARARNRRVVEERGDWHANMRRVEALFEALAACRRASGGRPPK
jgi:glycosyltransferase involved in cell wall biosynthesis